MGSEGSWDLFKLETDPRIVKFGQFVWLRRLPMGSEGSLGPLQSCQQGHWDPSKLGHWDPEGSLGPLQAIN
jgi:hypothetical protein